MSKQKQCPACLALERGFRSRVAFKHTCGQEPAAVKVVDDQEVPITFKEMKDSVLDSPYVSMKTKLHLLPLSDENEFVSKLVDELKIEE